MIYSGSIYTISLLIYFCSLVQSQYLFVFYLRTSTYKSKLITLHCMDKKYK